MNSTIITQTLKTKKGDKKPAPPSGAMCCAS